MRYAALFLILLAGCSSGRQHTNTPEQAEPTEPAEPQQPTLEERILEAFQALSDEVAIVAEWNEEDLDGYSEEGDETYSSEPLDRALTHIQSLAEAATTAGETELRRFLDESIATSEDDIRMFEESGIPRYIVDSLDFLRDVLMRSLDILATREEEAGITGRRTAICAYARLNASIDQQNLHDFVSVSHFLSPENQLIITGEYLELVNNALESALALERRLSSGGIPALHSDIDGAAEDFLVVARNSSAETYETHLRTIDQMAESTDEQWVRQALDQLITAVREDRDRINGQIEEMQAELEVFRQIPSHLETINSSWIGDMDGAIEMTREIIPVLATFDHPQAPDFASHLLDYTNAVIGSCGLGEPLTRAAQKGNI